MTKASRRGMDDPDLQSSPPECDVLIINKAAIVDRVILVVMSEHGVRSTDAKIESLQVSTTCSRSLQWRSDSNREGVPAR